MFGPCDHFILHILGKPDKLITVSADMYNKIPIFFRLCPCRFKCVCVKHIDLHLKSAAPGIGLNNTFKSIQSITTQRRFWKLHIYRDPAYEAVMLQFSRRNYRSGRTEQFSALTRSGSVCKRKSGASSVRSCRARRQQQILGWKVLFTALSYSMETTVLAAALLGKQFEAAECREDSGYKL